MTRLTILLSMSMCLMAVAVKEAKVKPGYSYQDAKKVCTKMNLVLCPSASLCKDKQLKEGIKSASKEEQW